VNGTDKHSRNPQIRFTDTGCYSVNLFVENSIGSNNLNKNCYIRAINFCQPSVNNLSPGIGISRVTLANLDHSSPTGLSAYTDYSADYTVELMAGASYPVQVSQSSGNNPVSRAVWIDYNQDGEFTPSELAASSINSTLQDWVGTIQ